MKLAILLQHYFPYGGLQRDALRLAEAAQEAGHQPTVITATWDGPKPNHLDLQILNSGGTKNHIKSKRFAAAAQAIFPNYDTSICFSRVPGSAFHFCGDPCTKEKIITNKPKIAQLLPRYRFLLENEASIFGPSQNTHLFFLAQSEIPPYHKHYNLDPSRYTVLPPWLKKTTDSDLPPPEVVAQILQKSPRAQILLFVGSDFHRKGLDLLIQSLPHAKTPDLHLLVCGQDNADSLQKTAQQNGSQVQFLGPRDDIPALMAHAHLLVHPARQETAGMVLTEALTSELPVLCTENCGYAEHVKSAGCLLLPTNPSLESIAKNIDQSLASREETLPLIQSWTNAPSRYQTAQIMLQKMEASL